MSFTNDLHGGLSSSSSDGRPAAEIVEVELDVRLLGSIVSESEGIHANDSELLARLEGADTVASGVEARLDEILDTLDDLLTHLEPKDGENPQEMTIPRSESQSGPPPSEQS